MNKIVEIEVLNNYYIWIKFQDGFEKIVNLKPFLGKGFTAELLNYDTFKKVQIESGGGLSWYNDYDFCPNFLRDYVPSEQIEELA